jgi:gliding motility-associated-like protein
MKQYSIYLYFLFSFSSLNAWGQSPNTSTVNNTGGSANYLNIVYEWSVGELALVESFLNKEYILNNGLLQTQKIALSSIQNISQIIPNNILTPNGDGDNDIWIIKDIKQYPENEILVFDRAGRQVFYSKNYQNSWDGKVEGKLLNEDIYYYIIKIIDGMKSEIKKGYLTIIH